MKTYQRRKGVIAWQYDTEESFWKWIKEAKFTLDFDTEEQLLGLKVNIFSDFGLEKLFFVHKGDWIVLELNNFTVYDNKTFKKLFKEMRQYDV